MDKELRVGLIAAIVIMAGLSFFMRYCVPKSYAHSSPTGWEYPDDCCSDDGKECNPIPPESVSMFFRTGDGAKMIAVTLKKGQHPNVYEDSVLTRLWNHKVRPSGDRLTHACINDGSLYCVFLPAGG